MASTLGWLMPMSRSLKRNVSVKSERLLERLGVPKAFADGEAIVPVGPAYALRDDRRARLAFSRGEEGETRVGVAIERDGRWEIDEAEPYSARALGYYERWLRRHGEREF